MSQISAACTVGGTPLSRACDGCDERTKSGRFVACLLSRLRTRGCTNRNTPPPAPAVSPIHSAVPAKPAGLFTPWVQGGGIIGIAPESGNSGPARPAGRLNPRQSAPCARLKRPFVSLALGQVLPELPSPAGVGSSGVWRDGFPLAGLRSATLTRRARESGREPFTFPRSRIALVWGKGVGNRVCVPGLNSAHGKGWIMHRDLGLLSGLMWLLLAAVAGADPTPQANSPQDVAPVRTVGREPGRNSGPVRGSRG